MGKRQGTVERAMKEAQESLSRRDACLETLRLLGFEIAGKDHQERIEGTGNFSDAAIERFLKAINTTGNQPFSDLLFSCLEGGTNAGLQRVIRNQIRRELEDCKRFGQVSLHRLELLANLKAAFGIGVLIESSEQGETHSRLADQLRGALEKVIRARFGRTTESEKLLSSVGLPNPEGRTQLREGGNSEHTTYAIHMDMAGIEE